MHRRAASRRRRSRSPGTSGPSAVSTRLRCRMPSSTITAATTTCSPHTVSKQGASCARAAMPDRGVPDHRAADGRLAIFGGEKVRPEPMPPRLALGPGEIEMMQQAIAFYRERNIDPGYQGAFEKLYTD